MKVKYIKWNTLFLINNEEYIGNDLLAKAISKKGYKKIIDEYVYIGPEDAKKTLQFIPEAWESFKGIGIDLGSGVGCISATIALRSEVKKIYSVEIVESVVKLCQPIVIDKILKNKKHKVISVVGDFDNIMLKGNSLDFAVSWYSMHHSNNPIVTFKECSRILKPGGKFVVVDRTHNNSTPESEIQRMLNIVYDEAFIKKNYRPKGTILKRKENGEHEYRIEQWEKFFKKAGFKIVSSVIIKTDNKENRSLKNDGNLCEVLTNYRIGGFGNRAIGFVALKEK